MSSGPFSAQDDSWVQDVVIERTRAFLPAFQARRLAAGSVPGLGELRRSAQLRDLAAELISVTQPPQPVVFVPPQNLSGWGTRPELAAAGGARKLPKKLAGESNRA